MSASPNRISSFDAVPVAAAVEAPSLMGIQGGRREKPVVTSAHDSGIENNSDASHCLHSTTDHEREGDATTDNSLTITHRGAEDSMSGSEILNDPRMPADDLVDYEVVQLGVEEGKVNETSWEATIPKTQPRTIPASTPISAAGTASDANRLDNGSNKVAASKAEKQRQNEEIIILESSSVSSETGSWESVSPEQLQQLHSHQLAGDGNLSDLTPVNNSAGSCSVVERGKGNSDYDAKPIRTACFIDASSLLDDTELAALPSNVEQRTSGSMQGEGEEPQIVTEIKMNQPEIRDQFSSGEYTPLQLSGSGTVLVGSLVSSGSSRKSGSPPRGEVVPVDAKETEKLQGNLVFKSSINQFSGVLIEKPEMPVYDDSGDRGGVSQDVEEATRSFPLRNAQSDFTSLMDIYQGNKKSGSGGIKFNYMRTQSENHAHEPQSIILPDTPHNSILNVNVVPGSGNHYRDRLMSSETEGNDQRQSEPAIEENRTPKRHLKYMESAPIVSGGVSVVDFSPKLCESPPVRRKLDSCPILSGGFVLADAQGGVEEPAKVVPRPTESTSFKSWVIDLNDLPQTKEVTNEEEEANRKAVKRTTQSVPAQNYSHFYVSLDDVQPSDGEIRSVCDNRKAANLNDISSETRKSTGFFVDFTSTDDSQADGATKSKAREKSMEKDETASGSESADDKKNIFSMFIDFGERRPVPKKESLSFTSRLSDSISRRKELERRSESPRRSTDQLVDGNGAEKCISLPFVPSLDRQSDQVQLRPKFRTSLSEDHRRRHPGDDDNSGKKESSGGVANPERPISFTPGDKGLMSIIDKIPLLSKTSSMSIDSSISPHEDFTCSKSELSTFSTSATSNSNNSSTKDLNRQLQVLGGAAEEQRRHQKDVKINETFDKSSQSSITDGVLSKDLSPDSATATNTDDLTYQNEPEKKPETEDDVLVKVKPVEVGLSTILEANEKLASPAKKMDKGTMREEQLVVGNQESTHTMETLQATIEKQRKLLLETVNEAAETTSFVRLSDMDKPFQSFEIYSSGGGSGLLGTPTLSKSDRRARSMVSHEVMTGRGGGGHYYEKSRYNNMYYSTDTNIINLASSFENSQSLSRIFPHLSKVFSSSLPTNVGLENMPSELTSMSSDLSANSSVTSSCNPSVQDSGDDSSIFCRQPKRLGEDLLKMFLHEIGTDVTIDIGGHRKLKAHKCILQSRCQYFAAILAGGYVHNAGNQISLPGYSYEAVHFALCHIYSGASHPPEGISLMELAAIADLLGLVGLREVTEYALKVNYCHNFHKPCLGCIEGILQVLPVALNHGLDDLYRKCLKWTCKHYMKIWPTRTFASLSSDLRHRCQQQIIAHLSPETVLLRILECENLLAVVAPLRWGASVEIILHEISDTAQVYLSEHFASLIASDSFLSLGHDQSCNIPALENLLLRSASTLSPDQACRSYQRVTKLHQVLHSKILTQQQNKVRTLVGVDGGNDDLDWDVDFIRLVGGILSAVEQCLQRQCSRAMRTSAWQRLDLELRKKIQKLACLTDPLFERRQRANARQQQKTPVYQANYNRNQDIQQVRLAIHAHSKRSAQGYIIDQFTNNNHNAGGGRAGGHNPFKSHSTTTQTQPHLNNNNNNQNGGKEKRDKSVQANNETARSSVNGAAKLEKSKSHSHVNASLAMGSNRGKAPPLAKSSSAVSQRNSTATANNRLGTEVKSRYMDIGVKQVHRVALPGNEAVRSVKQTDQFSSSGTSTRTASPLANRKAKQVNNNIDSHMSLDSLASPKKQARAAVALPVHHDESSLSRDSLVESLRSSKGTVSQELPPQRNRLSVDSRVMAKNLRNNQQRQMNGGGGSTSGSTSSVGTAAQQKKGGRLMRNFSDSGVVFRNPGNASKGLSSNTSSSNASTRTSFLSKKSREILERRSLVENRRSVEKEITVVSNGQEGPMRRSLPINKSSSTSNIPTNRRIFNTTLHLRKTAQVAIPETASETKSNGLKKESQVGQKPSRIAQKVPPIIRGKFTGQEQIKPFRKVEKSEQDLMSTEKAFEVLALAGNCGMHSMEGSDGFESKMVRSSTFSKDCPDLSQSIEIG